MIHNMFAYNDTDYASDSDDDNEMYRTLYQTVLRYGHVSPYEKYAQEPLTREVDGKNRCRYRPCQKDVQKCTNCYALICLSEKCVKVYSAVALCQVFPSKPHEACKDCKVIPTCHISGLCKSCARTHRYDMITDKVAIGDCYSSYEPFDIIVNLDYPHNGVHKNEVRIEQEGEKLVILCGFYDHPDAFKKKDIERILRLIPNVDIPILFHCTAGISRSSTIAIMYLSRRLGISVNDAYQLAKQKRNHINPNDGFRILIGLTALN